MVDPEKIGILGICGWADIGLNAAAVDPRIKATVAVTLYDMTRVTAFGYNDTATEEDRHKLRAQLAAQRLTDIRQGFIARAGGVVDPLPEAAPDSCFAHIAIEVPGRGASNECCEAVSEAEYGKLT